MNVQEVIDCLTNGVGEKPYCRREDEVMKVFVADDQLLCTVAKYDECDDGGPTAARYDEEIANAICEAGLMLQQRRQLIVQLRKQVLALQKGASSG